MYCVCGGGGGGISNFLSVLGVLGFNILFIYIFWYMTKVVLEFGCIFFLGGLLILSVSFSLVISRWPGGTL